jgi:predicted esterase
MEMPRSAQSVPRHCRVLLIVALALLVSPCARGDDTEPGVTIVAPSPERLQAPVQFLEEPPVIDGVLDSGLTHLSTRHFTRILSDPPQESAPQAAYRMAYGTEFFYLYIEAAAESLICRDRAFQFGDGFHMVIAAPRPGNQPTDEFYVLACSAVNDPRMEWTRHVFWYYNVHDIFKRTSDETQLEFADGDGIISFELLLPWRDVHPYHPWISDGIGFNLRFVKALGSNGKTAYDVVHPNCIACELQPRAYALLDFETPGIEGEPQTFVAASRGHITEDDSLSLTAVTITSKPGEDTIVVRAETAEGTLVAHQKEIYAFGTGLTHHTFGLNTTRMPSGGYSVSWRTTAAGIDGTTGLTVLPPLNAQGLRDRLAALPESVVPSTVTTLAFKLMELIAQIDSAKSYETCGAERIRLTRVQREIDRALAGDDPYASTTGFVRKAYRSELDSSLQPYMLQIPDDYDAGRSYPLFVFLHGSASTEYNLRDVTWMIPDGVIALAPRGRGTSNCYTFDHAQEDIAEAIHAVIADYPVDTTRIVLAGFSMGGYGVYRTFYETPKRFAALAVFSGPPNIANEWYPGENYPDFTDPALLGVFHGVPIFIFHGTEDRNAPFALTEALVAQLRAGGANVEYVAEPGKGHEAPGEKSLEIYNQWIRRILSH